MHSPLQTKSFDAGAAITKRRIVKVSGSDYAVIHATAGDIPIGVAAEVDVDSGDLVDVHVAGVVDVDCGGAVTRGAYVASDADGEAVDAGTGDSGIGIALASGVDGDIVPVLIAPFTNHA